MLYARKILKTRAHGSQITVETSRTGGNQQRIKMRQAKIPLDMGGAGEGRGGVNGRGRSPKQLVARVLAPPLLAPPRSLAAVGDDSPSAPRLRETRRARGSAEKQRGTHRTEECIRGRRSAL